MPAQKVLLEPTWAVTHEAVQELKGSPGTLDTQTNRQGSLCQPGHILLPSRVQTIVLGTKNPILCTVSQIKSAWVSDVMFVRETSLNGIAVCSTRILMSKHGWEVDWVNLWTVFTDISRVSFLQMTSLQNWYLISSRVSYSLYKIWKQLVSSLECCVSTPMLQDMPIFVFIHFPLCKDWRQISLSAL